MNKNFMIEVPEFDENAARYVLHLLERVQVPSQEAIAFVTLRLSLENFINKPTEDNTDG